MPKLDKSLSHELISTNNPRFGLAAKRLTGSLLRLISAPTKAL
jgi:hypothetical protein